MSAKMKAHCPACKGQSFTLYERLETANVFRVVGGEAKAMCASGEFPSQIGFRAACECGHSWTPRYDTATEVMDAEAEARR